MVTVAVGVDAPGMIWEITPCPAGAAGAAGNFAVVLGRGPNAMISGPAPRDVPLEPVGLVVSSAVLEELAEEKVLLPWGVEEEGGGGNKSSSLSARFAPRVAA